MEKQCNQLFKRLPINACPMNGHIVYFFYLLYLAIPTKTGHIQSDTNSEKEKKNILLSGAYIFLYEIISKLVHIISYHITVLIIFAYCVP